MKAVVFVDVQKDFIDGALKNEKAIEATPKIVEFAKECVKNGYKLYATRDTHEKTQYNWKGTNPSVVYNCKEKSIEYKATFGKDSETIPASGYLATLEGQRLPVEHCIEGTDGWMIDERLWNVIEGKATIVNKHTFGSFDLTEIIDEDIKAWDNKNYFDEIIICGFCSAICVSANAILLRAKFPNMKITVMKNLCACVTEESHNAAMKVLEMQQIDIV